MSDEFDSLDVIEKTAVEAALSRCRVLARQIEIEIRKKGPSTSLTSRCWQTFTPPLGTLPMSSDRKPTVGREPREGFALPNCQW
jgi:hypothetical protein